MTTTKNTRKAKPHRKNAASPIQMKVTPEVRKYVQGLAKKYFKKNMSALIRYALYHCSYTPLDKKKHKTKAEEELPTMPTLPQEAIDQLTAINTGINALLEELRRTGVNINQLAHKVNETWLFNPYLMTKAQLNEILSYEAQIKSCRAAIAALRSLIISTLTKQSEQT